MKLSFWILLFSILACGNPSENDKKETSKPPSDTKKNEPIIEFPDMDPPNASILGDWESTENSLSRKK